ncbi:MAG TPA: hypothetical protein VF587_08375, partial [Solirubrobacteraceae bacterium]
MLRGVLLTTVVLLAAGAAPAGGQVRVIPTDGGGIAGPRFAGEEVVWAQAMPGREIVTFAEGPAGRRVLDRQPAGEQDWWGTRRFDLAA